MRLKSNVFISASLAFLAVAGYSLFTFAYYVMRVLQFKYPLDFGEGILLQQTVTLAAAKSIYPPQLNIPPYTISSYPPLFPLAQVPFELLWGPAYWYGRALSLGCALLTAYLLFLVVRRASNNVLAATVSSVLLLTNPFLQFWSVLNRIDLLALALSWIGIVFVLFKSNSRAGVFFGAIALIAAVYTRQTYLLTVPSALVLSLLFERNFRAARDLVMLIGGGCVLIFCILQYCTTGGFSLHVITAHVDQFDLKRALFFVREFLISWPIATILALAFARNLWRSGGRFTWFAVIYLIITSIVALSVGKVGSHVNYLLEPSVAVSLLIGIGISALGSSTGKKREWINLTLMLLTLQIFYSLTPLSYQTKHLDTLAHESDQDKLLKLVKSLPEPILADETLGLLPLAGKSIYLQPFGMTQLVPSGHWDQSTLIAEINRHKFSAALINLSNGEFSDRRWTKEMAQALESAYTPVEVIGETTVFRPK